MARNSLTSLLMSFALIASVALPVTLVPFEAGAKERPRPAAQRCLGLAKKIGPSRVWWGRHVGYREVEPMFEWGPKRETFNAIGCFKSRKECENWLYWMRTDFPNFAAARPCRRGL